MRTPSKSTRKRRTGKSQLNTGRNDLTEIKRTHNERNEILNGPD
jgi:hypothetical protein